MNVPAPRVRALGLERGIVRLVEYDERWPGLFTSECARIQEHCRPLPLRLEHVGGTSIPGMCSKPVLDIAAGRPPQAPLEGYVEALQRAGYEHRGERGVPGREFFCRGDPRSHHLHLVEEGGPLWLGYLSFRNYLRNHPEAASRFAEAKRAFAGRFADDRDAYLAAKSALVEEILGRAGRVTAAG